MKKETLDFTPRVYFSLQLLKGFCTAAVETQLLTPDAHRLMSQLTCKAFRAQIHSFAGPVEEQTEKVPVLFEQLV